MIFTIQLFERHEYLLYNYDKRRIQQYDDFVSLQ
jgi:hypothetical protein